LRLDARGDRTSYVYDNDDRLTGQHYPDGTRVTFAYDLAGRRTLLNDATGRTSSTFDADGRLSLVVNPAGLRLTYAYDAASQRKYLIEPEGARFTYVFDADGRTSYVANPQAQRATYSYDAASRVTGIHFANTTRASYVYDNANRLLRVANLTSTNTTLSSFSYAVDAVGNRLRVVESTGNRVTWAYDKTYQLKNEQRSGSNSYNITYTYDAAGNRLTEINGGVRTTSTYNAANELTKTQVVAGVTTMTFDANGNLLTSRNPSNQRTSYTWDFENRLTQVSLPTAIVDTFTYNGDGQRVQKQDSTGTTKHVWDGQNILLETDGSNIIQVVYTIEPVLYGNLISQRRSGTPSFYLFDALGSTTQLTNSTGGVTDTDLFDSFGNVLLSTGSSTYPFRFAGQVGYYKDTDLSQYWLRARYFDAISGRFISRDPIATSIPAWSYGYAVNNPVSVIDPSGLVPNAGSNPNCFVMVAPRPKFTLPCIYGKWCGALCPSSNLPVRPNPKDCVDASCRDHDECYGDSFYFNTACDRVLCTNIIWCLQNGKCRTWQCKTAAAAMLALFCGGVPGRLPIIPFRPYPPKP
jgi:RHS repeat-associated protein